MNHIVFALREISGRGTFVAVSFRKCRGPCVVSQFFPVGWL
jgi:hypothetical protein